MTIDGNLNMVYFYYITFIFSKLYIFGKQAVKTDSQAITTMNLQQTGDQTWTTTTHLKIQYPKMNSTDSGFPVITQRL